MANTHMTIFGRARIGRPRWAIMILAVLAIFIVWLAVYSYRVHQQRVAARVVVKSGGEFKYDYEQNESGWWIADRQNSQIPAWLIDTLGADWFHDIEWVYMHGDKVSNDSLAELKRLPDLVVLGIHGSGTINDDGLTHIASLKKLQRLSLSDSRITDAGLQHVVTLSNLRQLELDGTLVTDAGARYLAQFTKLEELDVRQTPITGAGVNELRRALPNCRIKNLGGYSRALPEWKRRGQPSSDFEPGKVLLSEMHESASDDSTQALLPFLDSVTQPNGENEEH